MIATASAFVVLCSASYFFLTQLKTHVYVVIHHIGPLTWYDGPDIEMSPETASKINRELASMIAADSPNQGITCTVAPHGKRRVDVNYAGEIPVDLQDKLNAYIQEHTIDLIFKQPNAKLHR